MSRAAERFHDDSRRVSADHTHRHRIQGAMDKYSAATRGTQAAFRDWSQARRVAAEIKWEAVNDLARHLEEFEKNAGARGTTVHWASTGAQARQIVVDLLRSRQAKAIIKSKVMTSEEIHLNDLLIELGYDVVESDLGEWIQQLKGEAPYHFVFPCMHLSREEIRGIFERRVGACPSDDPEELTAFARHVLREKYIGADVGITGANFIVADTGMISITENEGNARLTGALPKMMITLVGIEKVVPRLSDLALFLPMLATAGTGQALTAYNTMYGGPRQPGEVDGPEEWHVVLLDNHRTRLLADPEQRDALHCIRCGACLNVCPVFKNIGGLSYGTTYQGPIGSVITPHLRGLQEWRHLSGASSLCGACTSVCPVKIDLHHHLLHNRRNAVQRRPLDDSEGVLWRLYGHVMNRPWLYRLAGSIGKRLQRFHRPIRGRRVDPMRSWTATRELPVLARQSFRAYWRSRR